LICSIILTISATVSLAQTTTGNLSGVVTDSNGAAVAGATVNVVSIETGAERTVTSNEEGFYSVQQLQPGNYRIKSRSRVLRFRKSKRFRSLSDKTAS
jgi:protocatechuate 3,4-dioxygenase beta subunit